jgi:hypothetical protein
MLSTERLALRHKESTKMSDDRVIRINMEPARSRKCGGCTLCCKVMPVGPPLAKPALTRCVHQSHAIGCKVYRRLESVSPGCRLWNCRWLVDEDTGDLKRPDRSHYVVDNFPDYVETQQHGSDERTPVEVIQIWADTDYPDAHQDPALRAYLIRKAMPGLVRFGGHEAFILVPPNRHPEGPHFLEIRTNLRKGPAHTAFEVINALTGGALK